MNRSVQAAFFGDRVSIRRTAVPSVRLFGTITVPSDVVSRNTLAPLERRLGVIGAAEVGEVDPHRPQLTGVHTEAAASVSRTGQGQFQHIPAVVFRLQEDALGVHPLSSSSSSFSKFVPTRFMQLESWSDRPDVAGPHLSRVYFRFFAAGEGGATTVLPEPFLVQPAHGALTSGVLSADDFRFPGLPG